MPLGWLAKTVISTGIKAGASLTVYAITKPTPPAPVPPTRNYHIYNVHTSVNTRNQDEKDLDSCLSFFEEGMEMLLTSLDRISYGDQCTATNMQSTRVHGLAREIDILAALDRDVFTTDVDKLKSVSMESFAWAKWSFKAAREDATRAFNDEALHVNDRVLAAKVRILSAIFGCLDEPETAAAACKLYLGELNAMPLISKEINKMNGLSHENKSQLLTHVAFLNYFVFLFTETLARNILNVYNWPRFSGSNTLSLHPIRSVGLRALTEGTKDSRYGIDPKSISFSDPIDATDLAVNSAGQFVVVGLDGSENTIVHVYNDSGEFQFAVTPTEEELDGVEFQPRAVFTDENDDIYVQTKAHQTTDEGASLLVFSKEGRFQRVISIQRGFMALEKKTGKIFVSNKNGVSVYESSGAFVRCFEAPEALRGSSSPVALCGGNTIIQTDIHDQNVYLMNDTGTEIRKFQVKQARGWKYISFNPVSGELIVSYLSKDLTNFQLDAYLRNGQHLATVKLPHDYSSHPRSVTVTPSGRIAILYENIVHLI